MAELLGHGESGSIRIGLRHVVGKPEELLHEHDERGFSGSGNSPYEQHRVQVVGSVAGEIPIPYERHRVHQNQVGSLVGVHLPKRSHELFVRRLFPSSDEGRAHVGFRSEYLVPRRGSRHESPTVEIQVEVLVILLFREAFLLHIPYSVLQEKNLLFLDEPEPDYRTNQRGVGIR